MFIFQYIEFNVLVNSHGPPGWILGQIIRVNIKSNMSENVKNQVDFYTARCQKVKSCVLCWKYCTKTKPKAGAQATEAG